MLPPAPSGRGAATSIDVPDHDATITKLGDLAGDAGLRRVTLLAWRDLDDPEAGGSEIHAHMVARYWAEAGLEVTMRTSFAAGHPQVAWRDGYRVIRKAGRYLVFPRAAVSQSLGWHGPSDGLVEIWNGMPFFSPLWARGPRVVFLHHHHAEMWDMTLPPRLARLGRTIESTLAPPLYRGTEIVTLSESSRRELVDEMGLRRERITVAPPGIDPMFSPGGERSPRPLVVAVGRLVPVKRFDALVRSLARVRERQPDLEAVIVGEGYLRDDLEALRRELGAEDWLALPGRVSDDELVDLYRRAWVVASASAREGWGMSLTEASACGTAVVATRISGHADAVIDEKTGLLVDRDADLEDAIGRIVSDGAERDRLARGGLAYASELTWEATALTTLGVLARDARRRRGLPPK
jgi:glycosyltransferase involved in cell wall biosynthesis